MDPPIIERLQIGDVRTLTLYPIAGQPAPLGTFAVDLPAVASLSTAGPASSVVITAQAAGTATVTVTVCGGAYAWQYRFTVAAVVVPCTYSHATLT